MDNNKNKILYNQFDMQHRWTCMDTRRLEIFYTDHMETGVLLERR
ncbi:Uncharacterised protein [Shewanella putrefaciens]|nr:Uncharacterised protein [Shewanella putrefaciens]